MNLNQTVAVKKMNDQQLLASTDRLVSEERRITLENLRTSNQPFKSHTLSETVSTSPLPRNMTKQPFTLKQHN
jgi:hypothetical protein